MHDLVSLARTFDGEPYSQRNPGRYQVDSGIKDCSGLWVAAHTLLSMPAPGYVSSTQAAYCYDSGLEKSVDWVMENGGVLFMGRDRGLQGWGSDGHVAVKLPDGPDGYETPAWGIGRHGVGQDSFVNRRWTGGASAFPELAAFNAPAPVPPPKPKPKPDPRRNDYEVGEDMLVAVTKDSRCTLFQGDRCHNIKPAQAYGLRAQNVPTLGQLEVLELLSLVRDLAPDQWAEFANNQPHADTPPA